VSPIALTPLDITNKDFPRKLRGYDTDAVDEFLNQVIREFEVLIRENSQLKGQIETLQSKVEQYHQMEDLINRTMVMAQEAAEEVRVNTKREGELILQEARVQAERLIQSTQAKSVRIYEENSDLVHAAQVLRTQVRSLLSSQLQAIDSLQDPFVRVAAAELRPEPSAGRRTGE
jgi:cell division initiation protein